MSKYIDLLDEDKPIAEQKFVCLSFVSPEDVIKNKQLFFFEQFVKQYDFTKSMEKFTQFINFVSFKYEIKSDDLHEQFKTFVETERSNLHTTVDDDYKFFVDNQETKLDEKYGEEHNFQTSVRGLKVRGVFPSQKEAELRCKMIREFDPNHDVYVGPVGLWVPFHPDAYKTGKVEYLEKELNDLMGEKKKNEESNKLKFENRVKESKLNAIQDNMKKAEETNNRLTQTINEKGELVTIKNMNTQEKNLGINASLEDIRRELFEGDDIVVGKTDHQHK
uniref:Uncharacterized protein n=1 Tax=viral metagenome TaxID=1070528 RepID=A0A6C0EYT6_9ZZZZ